METDNPAFRYIYEKYNIDFLPFETLSELIDFYSKDAAKVFAKSLGKNSNENLNHYFFDYFFFLFLASGIHDNFHKYNKDAYSAVIDGIHIEYYGNVEEEVISGTIHLISSNQTCFFRTIMNFYSKDSKSMLLFSIPLYLLNREIPATQLLEVSERILQIQTVWLEKCKDISTEVFGK